MKLAKELIKLMSDYYSLNNLNIKMKSPINQEYLEILKPDIIRTYLNPFGYVIEPEPWTPEELLLPLKDRRKIPTFEEQLKEVPQDLLTRTDLAVKGAVFLYLTEILSWNELKVLLNIGSSGVILYKNLPTDELGAYDVILSLLSVLFGKVNYNIDVLPSYNFKRLTKDVYYWDQPYYYYGYKAALSYNNLNDILENIDWFLDENPEALDVVNSRYDVLGMLRINNKFVQFVIEDNDLGSNGIVTEFDNLGLYNVALNLIRIDETTLGLNNTLFDFYKAVTEITRFSPDGITYEQIDWMTVRSYCKYVDTVIELDVIHADIEKIGNIIRDVQNFLIH